MTAKPRATSRRQAMAETREATLIKTLDKVAALITQAQKTGCLYRLRAGLLEWRCVKPFGHTGKCKTKLGVTFMRPEGIK